MKPLRQSQRVLLLSLLVFIAGCASSPSAPLIAHRGASHDAPENTLAAFNLAWERRADGIEGDFLLTGDGRIVCLHDKTTERTAGVDLAVAETSLAEMRRLDVGAWKDPAYAGERIPTLAEVLTTVPEGKLMYIEVKCGPEIVPALVRDVQEAPLAPEQVVIISFRESVIAAVKEALPAHRAFWLTGYEQDEQTGALTPTLDEILATLERCDADGLGSHAAAHIDRAFVREVHDAGYEFHVWTVDEPAVAQRFLDLGAASITTNRPAYLRAALRSSEFRSKQ
jgi:glycerophosphoryl diester phosphodiesterase